MKKLLSTLLTIILILQAGMFTATAESQEKEKMLNIVRKKVLTALAAMPDNQTPKTTKSASEDLVLSGEDIAVGNGKCSYLFRLGRNGTLVFDNHLERKYQGIDGKYQLYYEIDEANHHTLIVAGDFDRVITESPLLKILPAENRNRLLSKISEDSYSYQLALKNENELTFTNSLSFLYDSDQHGFSIDYRYDIPANKNTVKFSVSDATEQTIRTALAKMTERTIRTTLAEATEQTIRTAFMKATEYLKSLLPGN